VSSATEPQYSDRPGFHQWNLSAIKNFDLHERARLQFRAESFNLVNHPSFTGIDTTARFDTAGKLTGTYGAVTGAGPARVFWNSASS
jgi:hypothetical protein